MRAFIVLFSYHAAAVFNLPSDVLIGTGGAPYGAVVLNDDAPLLDLTSACGNAICPSVIIFGGKQWGTINIHGCKVGRTYVFVNKSLIDLGIVVQQDGGRFGSKAIGRFDVITCFCAEARVEEPDNEASDEISHGTSATILCR